MDFRVAVRKLYDILRARGQSSALNKFVIDFRCAAPSQKNESASDATAAKNRCSDVSFSELTEPNSTAFCKNVGQSSALPKHILDLLVIFKISASNSIRVEYRDQISHFLTLPVKIRGRGKIFEASLPVPHRTNVLIGLYF